MKYISVILPFLGGIIAILSFFYLAGDLMQLPVFVLSMMLSGIGMVMAIMDRDAGLAMLSGLILAFAGFLLFLSQFFFIPI